MDSTGENKMTREEFRELQNKKTNYDIIYDLVKVNDPCVKVVGVNRTRGTRHIAIMDENGSTICTHRNFR